MGLELTLSSIVISLALLKFTVVSAQQCSLMTGSIFEDCTAGGYNQTFRVPFQLSNNSKHSIKDYMSYVVKLPKRNCSVAAMGESILCSVYAPSCTEGNPNPNLPCRRVCSEFLKRCRADVDPFWLEYYVAFCTLLPNKTASSGQCFEPEGFEKYYNASTTGLLEDKCNRLIFPWCKGIGYEYTIIKESTQIAVYNDFYLKNYSDSAESNEDEATAKDSEISFLNEIIANNSGCAMDIKKMLCADFFPPCFPDEGLAFYTICNSICKRISQKCPATKTVRSYELYFQFCEERAFGESSHGYCKHTKWPKPMEWLHFFRDRRAKRPSSLSSKGISTPVIVTIVIVPLIVIGLAVLGVIIWRQRKNPLFFRFFKRNDDTRGFVKQDGKEHF